MNVDEIMTTAVQTCTADESLNVPAGIMREYDCGVVPVVAVDGSLVGVITDRDICMAALSFGRVLRELNVAQAMTEDVLSCRPDDTIEAAERVMRAGHVRRLPVVADDGRLAGIVSLDDIALSIVRAEPDVLLAGRSDESELARTLAAICRQRIIVEN
jgi:CBS domain-containing protein